MSMDQLDTEKHGMDVNVWDLVSQVIESRRDPRDVIREYLSNAAANEVDSKNIKLIYYNDPTYGPSLVFSDDGIGMDYTNDLSAPGRLDRFLAVAYGGHAGFQTDEFGYKGLGSKLAINCRRLEIKTHYKATGDNHFVFVEEPLKTLRENKQPEYKIVKGAGLSSHGTEIKILGYEYGQSVKAFQKDKLLKYLYFNTIIGHTKGRRMPNVVLKVEDGEYPLETGFQFIKEPTPSNWKTYEIKTPITKNITRNGKTVNVNLKGGYTLETGNTNITGKFTLSTGTSGLFLSVKGIPYEKLNINDFRGNFSTLQYKFCRFVAECDELFDNMDFTRATYLDNEHTQIFEEALRACFNELAETQEYKNFLKERERDRQKQKRESLDARKKKLEEPDQKYVYLKKDNKLIHRMPENEHDTLALLWKLEGANLLPFDSFESLEHTNLEGIDLIAHFRETPDSNTKKYVPIEVECIFENFLSHGHNINQTEAVICWDVDDDSTFRPVENCSYKLLTRIGDKDLPVFVLSRLDHIEVRDRTGKII